MELYSSRFGLEVQNGPNHVFFSKKKLLKYKMANVQQSEIVNTVGRDLFGGRRLFLLVCSICEMARCQLSSQVGGYVGGVHYSK